MNNHRVKNRGSFTDANLYDFQFNRKRRQPDPAPKQSMASQPASVQERFSKKSEADSQSTPKKLKADRNFHQASRTKTEQTARSAAPFWQADKWGLPSQESIKKQVSPQRQPLPAPTLPGRQGQALGAWQKDPWDLPPLPTTSPLWGFAQSTPSEGSFSNQGVFTFSPEQELSEENELKPLKTAESNNPWDWLLEDEERLLKNAEEDSLHLGENASFKLEGEELEEFKQFFKDFKNGEHRMYSIDQVADTNACTKLPLGSFHDVYRIEGDGKNLYKFVKDDLNKQFPGRRVVLLGSKEMEIDYRRYVLLHGYHSYLQLKKNGIAVPKILNNPLQDGFYKIEFIPGSVAIDEWKNSERGISDTAIAQLSQAKDIFLRMKKERKLLVPDFQPHNVRVNDKNELVVIDFCEDRQHDAFTKKLDDLLEDYLEAWSNGNPNVKKFLSEEVL